MNLLEGLMRIFMLYNRFLWCVGLFIVGGMILTGLGTVIKWRLFVRKQKRARLEADAEHYRPDGQPYPPCGRGLCDHCKQAFEKVYYLPEGRRLCPACYEQSEMR